MESNSSHLRIYETPTALISAAAALVASAVQDAVKKRGRCALVLAGGNTPRSLYQSLAQAPYKENIAWQGVHVFWGDERMVPPDHPDSNYRMVNETMLQHVPIPVDNIHRISGELLLAEAASAYEQTLRAFFGTKPMAFDFVLLGLGEDGHTASLFPKTNVLSEHKRPATEVYVPRLQSWRVTLTLPVLNAARQIAFLVSGKTKAEIVKNILRLDAPSLRWPASLVQPTSGRLTWLLDREAAALL